MAKIGIVGAGRWGTALAILLSRIGNEVSLYCLPEEEKRLTRFRESQFLAGFRLPDSVTISPEPKGSPDLEFLILAVPGMKLKDAWESWRGQIGQLTIIVNTTKIMMAKNHQMILPSNVIESAQFVHFVAAAFPQGVLRGSPTMATAFAHNNLDAHKVAELFRPTVIRVYISHDLIGGQIGSALKNVIAMASGMAAGLGFDEMTRATLVSRGLKEIRSFAFRHLGHQENFGEGTTVLTDLVGTSFSPHSRNCQFGYLMAKSGVEQAFASIIGVVEGVNTVRALAELSHDFEESMPISAAVWQILEGKESALEVIERLMSRPIKSEA